MKSLKIANEIKISNYLSKNKLLNDVLKKELAINISEIIETIFQLEKIKSHYNLKNFIICKLFKDIELVDYLKENKYISKDINISPIYYYLSKMYSFAVKIFFFINIIFLPEKIFFLCRKNIKKKYFALFNVDAIPDLSGKGGYIYIKNKINKPSIFVKELKLGESFFLNNIKNNNSKDVLLISKVFQNISFLRYLLKFYKKYFFERFEMIFSQSQNYKEKYRYFSNKICWEVFFYCFEIKKCFTNMLPCDLTSQIIQKKNSKETIFFYSSSTPNLSKTKNDGTFVDAIQYNKMNYSSLIANTISINYFKKKSNNFENFLNFKSIESRLDSSSKSKIIFFKKRLRLKKIVALFDNSTGYRGVLNNSEYLDCLKYYNFLIKKYNNFYFIFFKKDKKNFLYNSNFYNFKKLNFQLKKMKNFDNFIDLNNQLTTPEGIYLSDIVISQPYSSIIQEALSLGKTTAIYNNSKYIFDSDHSYSKINKKININKFKYKYRLLDKDIINLLKINSKISKNLGDDKNLPNLLNYLNN